MTTIPHLFRYQGDGEMKSLRPKRADAEFVIGQVYRLVEEHDRSIATHNHQFAFLDEVWHQLPERLADTYPTQIHFRKALLIDAGFYNEVVLDVGSNAAALRVAGQMRADDELARVVVRGPLVVRRTAKSQKRSEMDRKDFQAAKTAVIEIAATLIGTTPEALARNVENA